MNIGAKKSRLIEFLKRFFLIFISLVVTIYLLEIAYAFYNVSSYKFNKWSKNNLNRFDIYKKEISENQRTSVTISNYNHVKDNQNTLLPLSGISNIRTIFCNELGFWTIFNSDKYGFNNSKKTWEKDKFKFVLIGDSFVNGACVKHKNSIAGRLEAHGDVLNLGYAGNGPIAEYATLKEYFDGNINSENVIWFYYENDLQNLEFELKNEIMQNYFKNNEFSQNLINKQNQLNEISIKLIEKEFQKHLDKSNKLFRFNEIDFKRIILLKNLRHRLSWMIEEDLLNTNLITEKQSYDSKENILDLKKILINSKKLVENNDSNFYFVYLPQYPGVYDSYRYKVYKQVISIVKEADIKLIDLYINFSNHPDPKSLFPLRRYGHYNKDGYKIVIENLLKNLN